MNILMFTPYNTVQGRWGPGNREEEDWSAVPGKPLETHFFVMEIYENLLIIQWIHGLIRLLD